MSNSDQQRIIRYIGGECSNQEKQKFEKWVRRDPNRRRVYDSLLRSWELSNKIAMDRDSRASWNVLAEKLELTQTTKPRRVRISPVSLEVSGHPRPHNPGWIARIAAAVIVLVGVSWLALNYLKMPQRTQQFTMQEIKTQKGQRAEFLFGDGTRMLMNSASVVRFPVASRGTVREVFLSGEAYFEVAHVSDSKLIVHAGSALVEVLGTKFNIRAYPDDDRVLVIVKGGTIALSSEDLTVDTAKVILRAGQMSAVTNDGRVGVPKSIDVNQMLAWTQGKLVFENTPLCNALREIERWHDIQCAISDSSLLKRRVTVSFDGKNLTEILNVLSLSLDLTYQRTGNYVKFSPRGVTKK